MDDIKKQLLDMQQEILDELRASMEKSRIAASGDVGDIIDASVEDLYKDFYCLLSERNLNKLEKICQALEAIDNKTYGICLNCGEKIRKKRLQALPFTEYCVDCQKEMEQTRSVQHPANSEPVFVGPEIDYYSQSEPDDKKSRHMENMC